MKHSIFIFSLHLLATFGVQAQSLERQVIGSSGTFVTASWGSLSSTAGESMTNTFTTSAAVLTQGFQQPSQTGLAATSLLINTITTNVFPIPALNNINVVINNAAIGKHYAVSILNLPGQQLNLPYNDLSSGTETKLLFDLHSIANGQYLILITDELGQQVKTIKFTKTN